MKILLANYILGGTTGSETWTASLGHELTKLGHDVEYRTASQTVDFTPDLAIINHGECLNAFKHLSCPKIFTSHGVLPAQEQPVPGADVYVTVSEEVQDNLKAQGYGSVVIRNGIDCDKFQPLTEPNETLTSVLFSSNYQSSAEDTTRRAAEGLGLRFKAIGGQNRVTDVVSEIQAADLIVGLGRTAYEAMACGRNVVVFDYNGGDGFVTPETILEMRKNNCSGRRYRHPYTVEELKAELLKYSKENGARLRDYVLENNNMGIVARKYLELVV